MKIGDPLIYSRDTTEEEEIFMNEGQLYPFFEELIPKINTVSFYHFLFKKKTNLLKKAIQEYEQTGQVTSIKSHTGRELGIIRLFHIIFVVFTNLITIGDPIVYADDEQYDESRFQEEQEHYQQEAEYSENECYSPTSPVYRPSSPSYSPTSPTHE